MQTVEDMQRLIGTIPCHLSLSSGVRWHFLSCVLVGSLFIMLFFFFWVATYLLSTVVFDLSAQLFVYVFNS